MSSKLSIDNITTGYRTIKSGKDYDQYFKLPESKDKVIIEDGEVTQTVDLMKKVVWRYIDDTKQISKVLKGNSIEESCTNIWNFLYSHIQYRLDKQGVEQLRRPARSWYEREEGIDCDCFSIFASSILTNLQIPHSFRITKYGRDVFQHVYVIVHHGNKQYIIDPVLSKANYQKPYTEKKDFPMSLTGIDIAVLSGTTDEDLEQAVMATPLEGVGLGAMNESEEDQQLYAYLQATRNAIAQNPESIAFTDNPQEFLKMLDYALKYWNTPKRAEALAILARNEDNFNGEFALDGFEDEEDEELLGRLFKRRKKTKNRKKGFFKSIENASKKVKGGLKKAVKAVVKYSPVTAAARGGFLLAMKLNFKKMATKLKWAYATQEQVAKKGVSSAQWHMSKGALVKVESLFADKLQGKRSALKKAILNGRAGGLNGLGELGQLGEPVSATAAATLIATATPVIVATIKIMKDAGLMDPKENEEIDMSESEIQSLISSENQGDYSDESYSDDYSYDNQDSRNSQGKPASKFKTFIKNNPMVAIGTVGAALGLGYLAYSSFSKPKTPSKKSSLSGSSSKPRASTKPHSTSKVKTIKLS